MPNELQPHRVALLSQFPGGPEDEIIAGVLDYVDHSPRWQFAGYGHRPFRPFEQIDLGQVDGIIGSFFEREWADAVVEAGVAAVDTWTEFAQTPLPRITNDDVAIGRTGCEHLLERGLAHFGFLTAPHRWYCAQRLEGFRQVMEDAGRSWDVASIPLDDAMPPAERVDWCVRWLEGVPRPIGVMAATDFLAADLVNAAARIGLRVPDDVAVMGVDDDRWASAVAATPLSSIQLDTRRIGYLAAQTLAGLMEGGAPPPSQYLPPVGLVARRSTDIVVSEDPIVGHALRFIRDHAADRIDVEDVLDEVGVSRSTLFKRMKRSTGQTPRDAISRARIEQAKQLLIHTDATVDDIARRCGFQRAPRLHETFKRMTGMTPGQFRDQRAAR